MTDAEKEQTAIKIWKSSALGPSILSCTRCSECGIVLPGTALFSDVAVTTFCPHCKKAVLANKWPKNGIS